MAGGGLPHPVLLSTFLNMDEIVINGQAVEFKHVFYSWVCIAVLIVLSLIVRRRLTLVPGRMQNVFEAIIDTIENFVCGSMGEVGRKFVPLLTGIFIYIFSMNIMGLIPGFDAPTANLNSTVCMALFVLLFYNAVGLWKWKAHYVHHFTGPSKFLIPLMFPLEIVSHLSRPVSLSLRLFGNIRGEEIVMILFFVMAPILGTIPIYALFLLGKSMQAFVFFILTMVYIKGALEAPEH
ncbi:F0F1 ATP synthase subunit A [uncultured Desulfovibrio sp.]|uniref:F0F1 ATP synthase subunit A n=1 Tax=uncultured Desulfovibrio sp. TaxID=167968 RepID=UPI0026102129|nr:F0F1 ATP synthase subunit A [uncultured Desulfovibrio sp.]